MPENKKPDRRTIYSLTAILFLAIVMRLLPLSNYAIWGSDSGEYYALTNTLVEDGGLPDSYDGWGFAYPFFAGMEYICAALSLLCGFTSLQSLVWGIPVLSSFIVLPIFLISFRAFRETRAALAAAAILAVASPSVFTTSHPMPGSMGDLLALALFLPVMRLTEIRQKDPGTGIGSLIGYRRAWSHLLVFILYAVALTLTHHLTAYFVIITLAFYLLVRTVVHRQHDPCGKIIYLLLSIIVLLSWLYWFIAVPSFREKIVEEGLPGGAAAISVVIFTGMAVLYGFVRYRPGLRERAYIPRYPQFAPLQRMMLVYLIASVVALAIMAASGVPGTDIDLGSDVLIYGLPLVLLLSFAVIGPAFARSYLHGYFLYAWLGAIVLSLLFASITGSVVFIPYRHIQYLIEPVAIFAGLGMVKFYDYTRRDLQIVFDECDENGNPVQPRDGGAAQRFGSYFPALFASVIVILLVAAAATAYPPQEMLGGFEEGTTRDEMRAVLWEREHLEDDAKVATDHRMSSLTFGFAGRDASWDEAKLTLHAGNYGDCSEEIEREKVDHVLINRVIRKGAALRQWENAEPLSDRAVEKFEKAPFLKLYDDGTSQVYRIEGIDQ